MGIVPEEINEYSKSKSDIVVRKDNLATSISSDTFHCCMISVVDMVTGMMKMPDETDRDDEDA